MADETDLDELARRYLDLWQDQMSALASDPEAAETMTRMITAAGANASAAWAAWPALMAGFGPASPAGAGFGPASPAGAGFGPASPAGAGRDGEASEKDPNGAATEQARGSSAASAGRSAAGRATPPGAPAAAAASGHGGPDLDHLASRLAELEERVRALESGESGPRRRSGASGKPRGGQS